MKCSILVVDDSEITVSYCKGLFDRYKCMVDAADSFDNALEMMKKREYDLFIIDRKLVGDKDGTDLIGKGSATPEKCIILSEHLSEMVVDELVHFHKVPRAQIMVKPPDVTRLLPLAERILDKESSTSSPYLKFIQDFFPASWKFNLSWRKALTLISLFTVLGTLFSAYPTWKGYQLHQEYLTGLEVYCEDKFEHFYQSDKVSHSTYVESDVEVGRYRLVCRAYPDDFASIVIISLDDKFEPRKYWLAGPEYANKLGYDPDKSFLEVFLEAWIRSQPISRL